MALTRLARAKASRGPRIEMCAAFIGADFREKRIKTHNICG